MFLLIKNAFFYCDVFCYIHSFSTDFWFLDLISVRNGLRNCFERSVKMYQFVPIFVVHFFRRIFVKIDKKCSKSAKKGHFCTNFMSFVTFLLIFIYAKNIIIIYKNIKRISQKFLTNDRI